MGQHIHVIRKSTLKDVMAYLGWVSQDTLDRGRLLTEDEYLEAARQIFAKLAEDGITIDYNRAEEALKRKGARDER